MHIIRWYFINYTYHYISDSDRELVRYEVNATATGFKSRPLPAKKGIHCVSYYARTTGMGTGYLKTSLTEADTGEIISEFENVAEVEGREATLVYFDVPEQEKPFQVNT